MTSARLVEVHLALSCAGAFVEQLELVFFLIAAASLGNRLVGPFAVGLDSVHRALERARRLAGRTRHQRLEPRDQRVDLNEPRRDRARACVWVPFKEHFGEINARTTQDLLLFLNERIQMRR